jgi:hypothetical protein
MNKAAMLAEAAIVFLNHLEELMDADPSLEWKISTAQFNLLSSLAAEVRDENK